MADGTPIQWTDATWNPVRGCTRVSPGCGGPNNEGGCYAEKIAARFSDPGQPFHGFAARTSKGGRWTGKMALVPDMLKLPLRWKMPRKIFVNSMSDLFHEGLTFDDIVQVFAVMAIGRRHIYQVLTKRSARMLEFTTWLGTNSGHSALLRAVIRLGYSVDDVVHFLPLPNVWMGVSVEDQPRADERIPDLLMTPAAIRWISGEPLLGPLDIARYLPRTPERQKGTDWDRVGLNWVVVGGESGGPRSRIMHPYWEHSLRVQCANAGMAYFRKQWGDWQEYGGGNGWKRTSPDGKPIRGTVTSGDYPGTPLHGGKSFETRFPFSLPNNPGPCMVRVGKKNAGHLLNGVAHQEWPK